MTDVPNDFFEEDEPVEDVIRAFEQGDRRLTGCVAHGRAVFVYLAVPGNVAPAAGNEPLGELAAS